ncbi:transcription factor IIIA [Ciona intestinalis]
MASTCGEEKIFNAEKKKKMHTCSACPKQYKKQRHLRLHFARKHTNKDDWSHKCTECGKVFADQEILQRHKLSHDETYKAVCQIGDCRKEYKSTSALSKHKPTGPCINKHQQKENRKKYCCEVSDCDAKFSKHHLLKQHSYQHTAVPPFPCSKCDKRFLTLSHKVRHEKIHNGYSCKMCSINCSTWSLLRRHIAAEHKEVNKCDECGLSFKQPSQLKQHLQVHSEKRQVFKCTKCEKTYVNKYNFKMHFKIVHLNEKKFQCSHGGCNKIFAYKKSLKTHEIIHQEDYVPLPKKTRCDKLSCLSRITGFNHEKALLPEVA